MRQDSYRTWTIRPEIPATKRLVAVTQLFREFVDAWQRHAGLRVQSKDEGAAHAGEGVIFVPDRDVAARGSGTSITTQKPRPRPDLGMRLWVHGRPDVVAVFPTLVSDCASTNDEWVCGTVIWQL